MEEDSQLQLRDESDDVTDDILLKASQLLKMLKLM